MWLAYADTEGAGEEGAEHGRGDTSSTGRGGGLCLGAALKEGTRATRCWAFDRGMVMIHDSRQVCGFTLGDGNGGDSGTSAASMASIHDTLQQLSSIVHQDIAWSHPSGLKSKSTGPASCCCWSETQTPLIHASRKIDRREKATSRPLSSFLAAPPNPEREFRQLTGSHFKS